MQEYPWCSGKVSQETCKIFCATMRGMDLLLTNRTALAFWRNSIALGAAALTRRNNVPKSAPASVPNFTPETIRKLTCDNGPIHILLDSASKRGKRQNIAYHIRSTDLPRGSICQIGRFDNLDICVVSPEFCFVGISRDLSPLRHIQLGFELCGTYRIQTRDANEPVTRYQIPALSSTKTIRKLLASINGEMMSAKSARALEYTIDNAASPAECNLVLLLTLPHSRGGYGLPAPKLNHQYRIHSTLQRGYRCDLAWPKEHVVMEYDSDLFHSLPDDISKNASRYNDLQGKALTTFIATRGQLRSVSETDKLAKHLAAALGLRLRISSSRFQEKQAELRRALGFSR